MNTFRYNRLIGLFLAIIVVGLGLTGCSEETPHALAPATDTLNQTNAADLWQNALDEVAAMEGGEAILAELAPQIEAARATYTDAASKHLGARLFIAIDRTEVTLVPPFPPPHVNLEIDYFGVGTLIGRHTGFSPLTQDITVFPFVQWGEMTFFSSNNDELVCDFTGTSVPTETEGEVVFDGDITFTGGTGRFAGASGTGHYHGTASEITWTGRAIWWGLVDLD